MTGERKPKGDEGEKELASNTALAERPTDALAVATAFTPARVDVKGLIDSLDGEKLTIDLLQRVKVTPGGKPVWDVVAGMPAQSIEGVIILKQATRAFWSDKYTGSGSVTPPDCSSLDNTIGKGNRKLDGEDEDENSVHECSACPLAEFGTAINEKGEKTDGKACRQVTRIFMLVPGEVLPTLITLPPSSYRAALQYVVLMQSKRIPYFTAKTKMTLATKGMKSGFDVGIATFENVGLLDEAEAAAVQQYRDELLPYLNALSIVDVEATDQAAVANQ